MRKQKAVDRNYEIFLDSSVSGEAANMMISTGRNSEKGGNPIIVNKDSFSVIVGIIKRNYTKYDHYEMKNISRTTGRRIVADLREAADKVLACKGKDVLEVLEYHGDNKQKTIDDLVKRKVPISKMLAGIADYMETAYETSDWICVAEI